VKSTLIVLVPGTPGTELWFRPTDPGAKRILIFSSTWKWTFSALRWSTAFAQVLGRFDTTTFPTHGGKLGHVEHGGLFPARKFGLPRRIVPDLAHFGGYEALLNAIGGEPGFAMGHNVHAFPFDWRKSLLDNGIALHNFCQQLAKSLDRHEGVATKVVLVGHSAGGIVAKIALRQSQPFYENRDPLLITLGTPWKGAYSAAQFVVNGPPGMGEPGRVAARKMRGVAELISRESHSWCGVPPTNLRNSPLVEQALDEATSANFTTIDGISDSAIARHLAIVGVGFSTPKTARRKVVVNPERIRAVQKVEGDGVVTLSSATPTPSNTSSMFPVRGDHLNLPSTPAAIERTLTAIRNHDAITQTNPGNETEVI
jgi:pimeloyl-ACP methyl ester carboxylesterase